MKAAVLQTLASPFVVEELDYLPPEPDRVLVRTHATPFCSTDCTNWAGKFGKVPPVILGHASIGEVVEVGRDVRHVAVGQRVVVPGTPECGRCYAARSDVPISVRSCSTVPTVIRSSRYPVRGRRSVRRET